MTEKLRSTSLFSFIFYCLIFLHKIVYHHFNDPEFLVQMLFFMAFSFSTALLEGAFKSNSKQIKWLAIVEFSLRLLVLVSHLLYVFLSLNFVISLLGTAIIFVINLGIYFVIQKRLQVVDMEELPFTRPLTITSEKLAPLIHKSGVQSLIAITLFILIPFLSLMYQYQMLFLLSIVSVIVVVSVMLIVRIQLQLSKAVLRRAKYKGYFEGVGIVFGFVITMISFF